jgi:hypothetical protein
MKPDFFSPLAAWVAWSDFAWKTAETLLTSSQVIGHRVGRMTAPGAAWNASDRREFALMSQEKLEAASESALSIAAQITRANFELGLKAWQNWAAVAAAATSAATSRTTGDSILRYTRLTRAMLPLSGRTSQVIAASGRVARDALSPFHGRATANARRLRKKAR